MSVVNQLGDEQERRLKGYRLARIRNFENKDITIGQKRTMNECQEGD